VEVTVHDRGREIAVAAEAAQAISEAVEAVVTDVTGVLRLAVNERTIERLRHEEVAVEVVFAAPRRLELRGLARALTVRRLLVPLSGELASPAGLTVFVGANGGYGSGPLRSARDGAELKRLVAPLGVALD
jgi:hypothetical protein